MISIFLFSAITCNTLAGSSLKEVQGRLLKDATFINTDNKEFFEERKRREEVYTFMSKYFKYMVV
jgi:hypothetical protein